MTKIGKLVHENIVRGRNVDIYKLDNPWVYKQYSITAIELISPIEGVDKLNTGFEHAEFVLKDGFQNFLDKYPNLNWDTSIMNASEFPMIKLKLGDDMQAKFHLEPILEIIAKEKN